MADVDYLYEDDSTGQLTINDAGKAERVKAPEYTGASLSGPIPRYGYQGQVGIGGSMVSEATQGRAEEHGPQVVQHQPRELTPEELMAWANRQEEEIMERRRAGENETAVDPALIRTGYAGGEVPQWLAQYMDAEQHVGPDGMPIDTVKGNQYLSEQMNLRNLLNEQRKMGIR